MHAAQSVKISAMNSDNFSKYAAAMLELQQVFALYHPPESLEKWVPKIEQGLMVLSAYNRYLTPRRFVEEEEIPLNKHIDPMSVLQRLIPSSACHAPDNEVLYYERRNSVYG